MVNKKIIVGLTGQSGAGKSAVSKVFAESGFKIIDADKVARAIAEKQYILHALSDTFGSDVVIDGVLQRQKLANIVFSNKDKLVQLNNIMFPAILDEMRNIANSSSSNLIMYDAPQLFESGLNKECDYIIAVTAPRDVLMRRILRRDRLTITEAERRLNSQLSEEFFVENSDFHIQSGKGFRDMSRQAREIFEQITNI